MWCKQGYIDVSFVFISYYHNLYTIERSRLNTFYFRGTDGKGYTVTPVQADRLDKVFTRCEIEATWKDMGPTKAPGMDGMLHIL